jgi:hypothetical protein
MLFGQLSGQDCLRGNEAGLASQATSLYHVGVRPTQLSETNFCFALGKGLMPTILTMPPWSS